MAYGRKSYVEHVAVKVKDIDWHLRFFREVLGMTVREVMGPADRPEKLKGAAANIRSAIVGMWE